LHELHQLYKQLERELHEAKLNDKLDRKEIKSLLDCLNEVKEAFEHHLKRSEAELQSMKKDKEKLQCTVERMVENKNVFKKEIAYLQKNVADLNVELSREIDRLNEIVKQEGPEGPGSLT